LLGLSQGRPEKISGEEAGGILGPTKQSIYVEKRNIAVNLTRQVVSQKLNSIPPVMEEAAKKYT
jgi:hypothetical protein